MGMADLATGSMKSNNDVSLDSVCFGESATGASSQSLKAVYVRYRDHVFFRNVEAPAAQAIIREALGWVKEENDEVMLIECDRPLPECSSGFNGVVVVKSCIVSMVSLNFEHVLNCPHPLLKNRVCAPSQRSEKLSSKNHKGAKKID
jgi:hypothetical protein